MMSSPATSCEEEKKIQEVLENTVYLNLYLLTQKNADYRLKTAVLTTNVKLRL